MTAAHSSLLSRQRVFAILQEVSIMNHTGTVMVVMHDLWGRQPIASLLAEAGYQVIEASNGASGMRLAELHQPDAVLLAGRLPELDIDLLVDELRSRRCTRRIPVIVLRENIDLPPALARSVIDACTGPVARPMRNPVPPSRTLVLA